MKIDFNDPFLLIKEDRVSEEAKHFSELLRQYLNTCYVRVMEINTLVPQLEELAKKANDLTKQRSTEAEESGKELDNLCKDVDIIIENLNNMSTGIIKFKAISIPLISTCNDKVFFLQALQRLLKEANLVGTVAIKKGMKNFRDVIGLHSHYKAEGESELEYVKKKMEEYETKIKGLAKLVHELAGNKFLVTNLQHESKRKEEKIKKLEAELKGLLENQNLLSPPPQETPNHTPNEEKKEDYNSRILQLQDENEELRRKIINMEIEAKERDLQIQDTKETKTIGKLEKKGWFCC